MANGICGERKGMDLFIFEDGSARLLLYCIAWTIFLFLSLTLKTLSHLVPIHFQWQLNTRLSARINTNRRFCQNTIVHSIRIIESRFPQYPHWFFFSSFYSASHSKRMIFLAPQNRIKQFSFMFWWILNFDMYNMNGIIFTKYFELRFEWTFTTQ